MNLTDPFDVSLIEFRAGATFTDDKGTTKALALAYAESRAYMDRLDEVFGMAGWSCDAEAIDSKTVKCTVTIHGEENFYNRTAFGEDTDIMSAESRAFKRACAQLGIGRYLYSTKSTWAPAKKQGKSYVFTDSTQQWLRQNVLAKPQPAAQPQPAQTIDTQLNGNGAAPEQAEDKPADAPNELTPDELDLIESWGSPPAAQEWAVKSGSCENEHEARNSFAKIVNGDLGGKLTQKNMGQALTLYYRRQQEKLAQQPQPDAEEATA